MTQFAPNFGQQAGNKPPMDPDVQAALGLVGTKNDPTRGFSAQDFADIEAALKMPQEDVSLLERSALSLIKEDPELQLQYLQRKGYDAKIQDGDLRIKDRSGKFINVDPNEWSAREILADVIDVVPEIAEMAATVFATGTKALGALGAPVAGPAGLAAGAAVGGLATGGVELGKQALAKGLGLRESFAPERIGRQAAIGAAVPLALGGVGAAISKGAEKAGKFIFGGPTSRIPDVAGVQAAAKTLGTKATPGMLTTDPLARETEALLRSSHGGLGGFVTRGTVKAQKIALEDAAADIVSTRLGRTANEVGKKFADDITESVAKKLAPAEEIYQRIGGQLGDVKSVLDTPYKTLERLGKNADQLTPAARAKLADITQSLSTANSLEKLNTLRTSLRRGISPNDSQEIHTIAREMNDALTKARSESLTGAVRNLKGQFKPNEVKNILGDLKQADQIWAKTAKEVNSALLSKGDQARGLKRTVSGLFDRDVRGPGFKEAEKRLAEYLPMQNVEKAKALKVLSESGFDTLAQARIAEVAEKATLKGVVNPQSLVREMKKMAPEIQDLLLGSEKVKKLKAIETFLNAVPPVTNPSGTAQGLMALVPLMRQVSSISLSALDEFIKHKGPINKAVLFQTLNAALPKAGGQEQPKNRPGLLPKQ